MQQIENVSFIRAIVFGALMMLTFSCSNHQIKDAQAVLLIDYELNINGKKAFFSLPKDYSEHKIPKLESDYNEDDNRKFFYISQTNPNNYFTIIVGKEPPPLPSDYLDLYVRRAKNIGKAYINSITCTEKKTFNGHSLYYLMKFYRYPLPYNKYDINSGDSICSTFEYVTCYDNIRYHFVLYSEEPIDDFSYEEKRKVLESIRF